MALKGAALIAVLIVCSAVTMSHAGLVTVLFAESDAAGIESNAAATAPVRVQGDNQAELTLIVVPLTVSQYMAQQATYANSCDRVIERTENDPAEEDDFDPMPVEQVVASDATDATGSAEYNLIVSINNDITEEPLEYFLLWLNVSQSDNTDTISYQNNRRCIRVDIEVDTDDQIELQVVTLREEVSEDAGTVELIRINKIGEIEQPVVIQFSGSRPNSFEMVSSITLQPSDTFAVVNVTIIDDDIPENDDEQLVLLTSGSHATKDVRFTIKDDDEVTIGFTTTEVTVVEGEPVRLTVQVMDGVTSDRFDAFRVFTDRGKGNATANVHYNATNNSNFYVGNTIVIPTIDDDILERSRQFEVRLEGSNPLDILDPNHVVVTIRDNDGIPNKPTVTNIEFNRESNQGEVSVTWNIEKHDLRPIDRYFIIFQVSGPEPKPGDKDDTKEEGDGKGDGDETGGEGGQEKRQFNVTVDADSVVCKQNVTGSYCRLVINGNSTLGSTYSIIVCAENEFGTTCGDATMATPTAAPLIPEETSGLPRGTVAGIVIAVLLGILMCCLLWIMVFFVCYCCIFGGEREKNYFPEKRERQNQKLQEKYDRIKTSESPDPPNIYSDDINV